MSDPTPKPFTIEIEEHGTTVLVRCHGKLTAEYADQLYTPVSALLPQPPARHPRPPHLTHMDSMGLGAVVRLYVHAKNRGTTGPLRILVPIDRATSSSSPTLLPAFAMTGEHHIRM